MRHKKHKRRESLRIAEKESREGLAGQIPMAPDNRLPLILDEKAFQIARINHAPRKVILRQGQSPGDILTMTRSLADLKKTFPDWLIDVRSPAPAIFENNPHLTPLDENDPTVEKFDIAYGDVEPVRTGIHISGWYGQHFSDAFHDDMEKKLGVKFEKTGICPELWISEQEKHWINQVEAEFGWHGAFWLINAGRKPDNDLKQYHRWQEVVDLFNEEFKGAVRLVQIGYINPDNPSTSHIHPKLDGVYDLVGKTDLRQLIRLGYWSHGSIGPISFQFVMSAALNQPHVVVAGGKEGVRWQIYPHGQYLYSNGCLKCCAWDGCWKGGANNLCVDLVYGVPRCFYIITPERIVESVKMFYSGGIIDYTRGK